MSRCMVQPRGGGKKTQYGRGMKYSKVSNNFCKSRCTENVAELNTKDANEISPEISVSCVHF